MAINIAKGTEMVYAAIRYVFCGIVFVVGYIIVRKSKIIKKKRAYILLVSVCIILCSAAHLFPAENLFIDFNSPEDVFWYTCSGEILDITYGDDSCMVYYSEGNSKYAHSIMPKSAAGYKIPSVFSVREISNRFDQDGAFNVFSVTKTNDYYVLGTFFLYPSEIDVYNGDDEKVEVDIKRLDDSPFMYFFLEDYAEGHYLVADGTKIPLAQR